MDDDTKPSFLKTSTPVLGFLTLQPYFPRNPPVSEFLTFDDTCNSKFYPMCSLEYIERKLARIDYLGRDIATTLLAIFF